MQGQRLGVGLGGSGVRNGRRGSLSRAMKMLGKKARIKSERNSRVDVREVL